MQGVPKLKESIGNEEEPEAKVNREIRLLFREKDALEERLKEAEREVQVQKEERRELAARLMAAEQQLKGQ